MRLRDYFRGEAVELESRLRRDELQDRIEAATVSRWTLFEQGVVGWARCGRIRLRFRPRLVQYRMGPILAGSIDDSSGPSRLHLRFRAPGSAYVFFALWYAFMLVFLGFVLFGDVPAPAPGAERLMPPLLLFLFLLAPLGIHYLGTRDAPAQLAELVKFLEEKAEAHRIDGGSRSTD